MPVSPHSSRESAPPSTTRREFIGWSGKALSLLALSRLGAGPFISAAQIAKSPGADRRILVLIQLVGGNDGLNTIIPLEDDHYYRLRPTLAIASSLVLPLDDHCGFHPACRAMRELCQAGKMSVVQNVGYSQPSRSHFRSAEIWAAGGREPEFQGTGWLGRYLDLTAADNRDNALPPMAAYLMTDKPTCLSQASSEDRSVSLSRRGEGFAASLQRVASHIATDSSTQIYVLSLGGFDTHSHQAHPHRNLLSTLSNGMQAFHQALVSRGLDRQVLTMTVSEFGRSAAENESRGTDHGTAAPLFIMGSGLSGTLIGTPPALASDRHQDPVPSTDFRQVYATVLEDWLGCPAESVMGSPMPKLPLFAAPPDAVTE